MKREGSFSRRMMTILLMVTMIFAMMPAMAFAADNHQGQVRVIVENTTFTPESEGWSDSYWSGTLMDQWVDLQAGDNMLSCVTKALDAKGCTYNVDSSWGPDSAYLTEINGLASGAGPSYAGGWMGSLNDWFTANGFAFYNAADGTLQAGDEIRIVYSMNWGADVGSLYGTTDTSLKGLAFSKGTLDKPFESDSHEYTLTVPKGTGSVQVTPTAVNKNFLVGIFSEGSEFKRSQEVPVKNGTVIDVIVNYEGAPTMESCQESTAYTVNVVEENSEEVIKPTSSSKAANVFVGDTYSVDLAQVFGSETGDELSFTVSVNGREPVKAAGNYSYKIEKAGKTVLQFTAKNSAGVSGKYTVYLTAYDKPEAAATVSAAYSSTEKYLNSLELPSSGETGANWIVVALSRAGKLSQAKAEAYYKNVCEFVKKNINDKGQISRSKATENARLVIGLTSIGKDAANVEGYNLLSALADMKYVQRQGISGTIWTLIAFDSGNYDIPECKEGQQQVTREKLVKALLDAQLEDDGWALTGDTADPDITAMAIQALTPYYHENKDVKKAVDKGVSRLSAMQLEDGCFGGITGVNSESVSQVIIALTGLGIDPAKDERFIKNGNSAMDALMTFSDKDGGFRHLNVPGQSAVDGKATEQAMLAMTAYYRFLNGESGLYDMEKVTSTISDDDKDTKDEPKQNEDAPKTGDSNDLMPWVILMMLSASACAAAYKRREE